METAVGVPAGLECAIDVVAMVLVVVVFLEAEPFEQFVRLWEQGFEDRIAVVQRLLRLQIDDRVFECFGLPSLCDLFGIERVYRVDLLQRCLVAVLLNEFGGTVHIRLCGALGVEPCTSAEAKYDRSCRQAIYI